MDTVREGGCGAGSRPSRRLAVKPVLVAVAAGLLSAISLVAITPAAARSDVAHRSSGAHPVAGSTRPRPLGVQGTWSLKFDDEFNGSSLDLGKWQPNWLAGDNSSVMHPPNSDDINCTDPGQVSEGGGVLRLTAVQRSCAADNGVTYRYASGLVNTNSSFQFTHGYMEARIYLPSEGGHLLDFPQFWADGTGNWPSTGELDVMEVLGNCVGYHFHSDSGGPGSCASVRNPGGWHVFGARWEAGAVTYYYDGVQVGRITSGITDSPMYLILDNCVDPTWGGATSAPVSMLVDYVRVWQ